MKSTPRELLEQTLFMWSVVHNTVLMFKDRAMIGRHHEPFKGDEYLDRDHIELLLQDGKWVGEVRETTNGTFLNGATLNAGQKIEIHPFDVLMGGDQILIAMDRQIVNVTSREDFFGRLVLPGDEFAEQNKTIQVRSLAFFKLEFPNFVNLIKRTELQRKIEIAEVKRANDLKPYDDKIAEIQVKRNKIAQAWNAKIQEFQTAIDQIKDNT